ncbi:hypothetical protein PPERSA_04994 [Pseudocohnilembus persalinus]|uniref:Uncharacterized protein n=1 Tax=Pseudocohnilembus persalinus TaxID=266149 RepID=A0A0V0QWD2_PSEPJ|nr:hypothetical protein PPERSA_04994 [Pseudocohnilembus persalinus]|eukprot:KRX06381.1 hypothetical protein PPERSA_04994 [Pseudocohnilembus persalinus]
MKQLFDQGLTPCQIESKIKDFDKELGCSRRTLYRKHKAYQTYLKNIDIIEEKNWYDNPEKQIQKYKKKQKVYELAQNQGEKFEDLKSFTQFYKENITEEKDLQHLEKKIAREFPQFYQKKVRNVNISNLIQMFMNNIPEKKKSNCSNTQECILQN